MRYPKRTQYKYAKSHNRVQNWADYEAGLQMRGAVYEAAQGKGDGQRGRCSSHQVGMPNRLRARCLARGRGAGTSGPCTNPSPGSIGIERRLPVGPLSAGCDVRAGLFHLSRGPMTRSVPEKGPDRTRADPHPGLGGAGSNPPGCSGSSPIARATGSRRAVPLGLEG